MQQFMFLRQQVGQDDAGVAFVLCFLFLIVSSTERF